MSRILAIHGFLGNPKQWDGLSEGGELHALDLYQFSSIKEIEKEFLRIDPDILVGYSMGGRIALHLSSFHQDKLKKVIILGANIEGLTDEERTDRQEWENEWIVQMDSSDLTSFMTQWNGQPIFESDDPISAPDKTMEEIKRLFSLYPLSIQPSFKELVSNNDKFYFLVGEKDHKYRELYQKLNLKNIQAVSKLGHRILKEKTIELIKKMIIEGA